MLGHVQPLLVGTQSGQRVRWMQLCLCFDVLMRKGAVYSKRVKVKSRKSGSFSQSHFHVFGALVLGGAESNFYNMYALGRHCCALVSGPVLCTRECTFSKLGANFAFTSFKPVVRMWKFEHVDRPFAIALHRNAVVLEQLSLVGPSSADFFGSDALFEGQPSGNDGVTHGQHNGVQCVKRGRLLVQELCCKDFLRCIRALLKPL
jgi:hypothetical protein